MTPREFFDAVPWHATDFDGDEMFTATVEFGKVKTAAGQDPLLSALWLAQERPAVTGGRFEHFKKYALFLNIAFYLQRLQGDSDIFLPCERLKAILGVALQTVSDYRTMAQMEGYLKQTKRHTPKKATRFKVDFTRYPQIQEMQ